MTLFGKESIVFVLLVATLCQMAFYYENDHASACAALSENAIMSYLFFIEIKRIKNVKETSYVIAWEKMLGTLLATIYCCRIPFVLFMGTTAFIYDVRYIIELNKNINKDEVPIF